MTLRAWLRTRPVLVFLATWVFLMVSWIGFSGRPVLAGAVRAVPLAVGFAVVWETTGWVSTKVYRALFA